MRYEDLRNQLRWSPGVENGPVPEYTEVVVGGMGGSALPAYALRFLDPTAPVSVHHDYDLPEHAPEGTLFVAISFSGNTEETLSFAKAAEKKKLPLAVVCAGGELALFAREKKVPTVFVPHEGEPRNATFYLLRALLAIMKKDALLKTLSDVAFDEEPVRAAAEKAAPSLHGALPVFYASRANGFLAHLAKIMVNETGKMPAFANLFPEVNHNEMQSFDESAPEVVGKLLRFVLLRDHGDDVRIKNRMDTFRECMEDRGRKVVEMELQGNTRAEKLARGWFMSYLLARALASARGVEPDAVPLVEDFKKRLKSRGK